MNNNPKLVALPGPSKETEKAYYFESAKVNDNGFWLPKSVIKIIYTDSNNNPVHKNDPACTWIKFYAFSWIISKNNLWSKLQGTAI